MSCQKCQLAMQHTALCTIDLAKRGMGCRVEGALTGSIPAAYASWQALREFDVGKTQLSGTLPPALFSSWPLLEALIIEGEMVTRAPAAPRLASAAAAAAAAAQHQAAPQAARLPGGSLCAHMDQHDPCRLSDQRLAAQPLGLRPAEAPAHQPDAHQQPCRAGLLDV